MQSPIITILICSHNPRKDYLSQVLEALRRQTLEKAAWELLIIDNASSSPLMKDYDLYWHPMARHLSVSQLGKTHALLQGVYEARGNILVIVDDDNVLAPDYLSNVVVIFNENPSLGVIGGRIKGEFEVEPPEWAKPYLIFLAIIDLGDQPFYSASFAEFAYVPPGAGMALRRIVAQDYARQIKSDSLRQGFDPVGKKLSRAGDTDMALCALDMGLAKGYFPELRLTHLIPKGRLELKYMQALVEGSEYSITLLSLIRGLILPQTVLPRWRQRLFDLRQQFKNRNADPTQLIELARERGRASAHACYLTSCSSESHDNPML
jgi:glycosyltransferase involved in cell wall biosynthesis